MKLYAYWEFASDPIGNRSAYKEAAQTATTYTTNNLNQYGSTSYPTEEFLYDLDGNMISTGTTTNSFNIENRLEMVSPKKQYPIDYDKKVEYTYDYKGRRISREVWTYYSGAWSQTPTEYAKYVWDGWLLIAELDGNNSDAVLSTYTWGLDLSGTMEGAGGIGGLLAASKKTGTSIDLGYLYDGNGNVTQLFDLSDGSEEGHYEYDPFGKEIVASGNQCEWNKFRFSTKSLEDVVIDASNGSELGLYYYGYRYYSLRLGRWITRGPIGEHGGKNLFALVKNNPTSQFDRLGLCKIGEFRKVKCQFDVVPASIIPGLKKNRDELIDALNQIDNAQDLATLLTIIASYYTGGAALTIEELVQIIIDKAHFPIDPQEMARRIAGLADRFRGEWHGYNLYTQVLYQECVCHMFFFSKWKDRDTDWREYSKNGWDLRGTFHDVVGAIIFGQKACKEHLDEFKNATSCNK